MAGAISSSIAIEFKGEKSGQIDYKVNIKIAGIFQLFLFPTNSAFVFNDTITLTIFAL